MSKKIVVKLDLHDNKDKQKAMKAVSSVVGIDAISMDMASRKMTVIGTVDPVDVVSKLRKSSWAAYIESVGPAKEPEKEEANKEGGGDGKKEGGGDGKKEEGGGDGKKDGEGKKEGDGEGKKEGDGKKESDGGKKDGDGDGKKEGDNAKAIKKEDGGSGGGEKKPSAVAPMPMPMQMHHLPPQYFNIEYMNQYHRPPPPAYPYVPPPPQHYYVRNMSMEENPNSCAIC